MTYRDILRAQLYLDEGKRNSMYLDSVGVATIGVGHNLKDRPISDKAVEQILSDDIDIAEKDARRLLPNFDSLSPVRQAVVINLSFNLGHARLAGFVNTLKAINQGRYEDAAAGMLASKWATQVGARAKRLADAMRIG